MTASGARLDVGKTVNLLVSLHIAAGSVGLLAGAASLTFRKGRRSHRLLGRVFVVAMLFMSGSSVYLALSKSEPDNVIVGALTFYLVASGWTTLRGGRKWSWNDTIALFAICAVTATGLAYGWEAASSDDGLKDGIPAPSLFFLAGVAGTFASSDVLRLIRGSGSKERRIGRHLWRMCFALFIATLSLFFGQSQVLPDFLRAGNLNLMPVFLVSGLTVFWFVRVRFFGWTQGSALRAPIHLRLGQAVGVTNTGPTRR